MKRTMEKAIQRRERERGGERYPVRISQKRKQISILGEKKT